MKKKLLFLALVAPIGMMTTHSAVAMWGVEFEVYATDPLSRGFAKPDFSSERSRKNQLVFPYNHQAIKKSPVPHTDEESKEDQTENITLDKV